jgi:hypothetical protein
VKCALPTRWSAALDQPVSNLAVAAELPWIWIPRTISPDYHDQVVACYRAAGFAPDARHAVSLRGLNRLVGGFLDSVRAVLDSSSPQDIPSAPGRVPACLFRNRSGPQAGDQ